MGWGLDECALVHFLSPRKHCHARQRRSKFSVSSADILSALSTSICLKPVRHHCHRHDCNRRVADGRLYCPLHTAKPGTGTMRLNIELSALVAWRVNILAQHAGLPAAEWIARTIAKRCES